MPMVMLEYLNYWNCFHFLMISRCDVVNRCLAVDVHPALHVAWLIMLSPLLHYYLHTLVVFVFLPVNHNFCGILEICGFIL